MESFDFSSVNNECVFFLLQGWKNWMYKSSIICCLSSILYLSFAYGWLLRVMQQNTMVHLTIWLKDLNAQRQLPLVFLGVVMGVFFLQHQEICCLQFCCTAYGIGMVLPFFFFFWSYGMTRFLYYCYTLRFICLVLMVINKTRRHLFKDKDNQWLPHREYRLIHVSATSTIWFSSLKRMVRDQEVILELNDWIICLIVSIYPFNHPMKWAFSCHFNRTMYSIDYDLQIINNTEKSHMNILIWIQR